MPIFTSVRTGELQGSATPLQLPDIPCRMAYIKARDDNAGNVYLGGTVGVTVPNGTTDATTGYCLSKSESVLLEIGNLNVLYRICDNAGDDLTYIVYG